MISLARGYLDHESAHISETNFDLVKRYGLTPIEKHVWNIIEDYRIEKVFGERYPGCKTNFEWLILRFFDQDSDPGSSPEMTVLNWLLMTVRSWSVPQIRSRVEALEKAVEADYPGLTDKLLPVLLDIKTNCPDTASAVESAREIIRLISDYSDQKELKIESRTNIRDDNTISDKKEESQESGDKDQKPCLENETKTCEIGENADCFEADEGQNPTGNLELDSDYRSKQSALKSLLNKAKTELPESLESMIESTLSEMTKSVECGSVCVAEPRALALSELSDSQVNETRRTTLLLRSHLQNLLQGMTLKRSSPGCHGRLDTNLVNRIPMGSSKVFRAKAMRQGLDVAVHLLLDASGSMSSLIGLASTASYSLCEALSCVPGVNVAVTAFPGGPSKHAWHPDLKWSTVAPILKHGQRMHRKFGVTASGNTPLAQALWYAMTEMAALRESRKIIFIVTDGEPDSVDDTQAAVKVAQNLKLELFGLGLGDQSIKILLPGRSVVLVNLTDLPRKLFLLLGKAININL
jgi:hypothetical protein